MFQSFRLTVCCCLGFLAFAWMAAPLSAQDAGSSVRPALGSDGHGHGVHLPLSSERNFTREQQARIEWLFKQIICSCTRENWTKTLEGCPDGCANPQKEQVRDGVTTGLSNDAILDKQLAMFGPQVLARTSAQGVVGFLLYILPFVGLLVFAVLIVSFLTRVIKPASATEAAAKASEKGKSSGSDQQWDDEIERELEQMD